MNTATGRGVFWNVPVAAAGSLLLLFTAAVMLETGIPRLLWQPLLLGAALYFFVQGKLPRASTLAVFLSVYLPFAGQLAYDTASLPSPVVVTWILTGLALLSSFLEERRFPALAGFKSAVSLPFCFFLAAAAVSVITAVLSGAPAPEVLRDFSGRWLSFGLIFFSVFRAVRNRTDASRILLAVCFAFAAAALQGILEMRELAGAGDMEDARVGGAANDPNVLAAFLNYGIFIPAAFAFTNLKRRWPALVAPALGLRALLGTFSRGGYLAFAAGAYTFAFFRSRVLVAVLAVASLAALFHPALLPSSMRERLMQTFEKPVAAESPDGIGQSLDRSNRDRIEIWKGTIQMIKQHPVFGVGYGRFRTVIADYWYDRKPFDAHNTYLFIAAEMGLAALGLFLWLYAALWRTALRLRRSAGTLEQTLAAGFLAGMASLVMSHLYVIRLDSLESAGLFWVLAALVARLDTLNSGDSGAGKESTV